MNFKENESSIKLRGGYYTPPEIAIFLTKWVLQHPAPHRILEPSIGDGIFLDALRQLDASKVTAVVGFEIDESEVCKAQQKANLCDQIHITIHNHDFLSWALCHFQHPQFDAVIGNPPFIRYQYLDDQSQDYAAEIFRCFRLPFTKHTNLWVPFMIAAMALLVPGGRLAMVVPAELLHVMHAQALRSYLVRTCRKLLIVDPEEIWFEQTLQGAMLLLAEKKGDPHENCLGLRIIRTQGKRFLAQDPASLFAHTDLLNGTVLHGKWLRAFLTPHELALLDDVTSRKFVQLFQTVAKVDVGIVTGANKFFLVPDQIVEQYQLQPWAHPMFGRSEHCPGIIYDDIQHECNRKQGFPTNFLWLTEEQQEQFTERVREYILMGEQQHLDRRYKCRVRTPWYKVPSVYATPIGLLKRCHDLPRLLYNKLGAYTTDTAYRIVPFDIAPEELVYCFINSLTALSAELEGRHYGGGVLELVPSEIERLSIPLPDRIEIQLTVLDELFKRGEQTEQILFRQDAIILTALGLSPQQQLDLRLAWDKLRKRRQRITVSDYQ